jgi:hypothetical protein
MSMLNYQPAEFECPRLPPLPTSEPSPFRPYLPVFVGEPPRDCMSNNPSNTAGDVSKMRVGLAVSTPPFLNLVRHTW